MLARWTVAVVGVIALAAVAVNYYMPWRAQNAPMQVVKIDPANTASNRERAPGAGEFDKATEMLVCPADARPAPLKFTLKDASNRSVDLASYKGKVILLDFWATWCAPCKVEIPGFVEFQNTYGKDGFQVVGISTDDTPALLTPFMKQFKMNYPVLQGLGRDEVLDAFGPLVGLPTTLLISREAKICATHAGFTDKGTFEREIKALL